MGLFRRLSNLVRGLLGRFFGGRERSEPEALLAIERAHLAEQIAKFNQGLASHAALCEQLMAQIRQQEREEGQLKARITAHLRAGNRGAAGQFALRRKQLQGDLADNRRQLESAEETYQNLVKARDVSIGAAKAKIESLRVSISDMRVAQATAELTEMAAGMVTDIGGADDTLSRLEEMVREERAYSAGRARVARDLLDATEVDLKVSEQEALAEAALADFAAKEGVTLEPTQAPESAPTRARKSIGRQRESS